MSKKMALFFALFCSTLSAQKIIYSNQKLYFFPETLNLETAKNPQKLIRQMKIQYYLFFVPLNEKEIASLNKFVDSKDLEALFEKTLLKQELKEYIPLAVVLLKEGKYQESEQLIRRHLQTFPNDSERLNYLYQAINLLEAPL